MQEYYFTCGGSAIAFFVSGGRVASLLVTRTMYQVSIVKTPVDSVEKLGRWRKHAELSKEKFFKIYDAAISLNQPGKQKFLEWLVPVDPETATDF